MQLISVFIVAALLATVLGAETFCDTDSFVTESFDAVNVVLVKSIYNAEIRASLHERIGSPAEFILVDFTNGRVYVTQADGSCDYYENEDVKALSGAPPAGLKPSITINGTNPIIQFVFPVGDLVFRTWQIGTGDDCEVIFFAMYVNNSPVLAYVHDNNKDADPADLQRVVDTLAQVQQAGCTLLTAS